MVDLLVTFVGGILGVVTDLYIISRINGDEIKLKINPINILLLLIISILTPLCFIIPDTVMRLLIMYLISFLIYAKVFEMSISKTAISVLITRILEIPIELLFVILVGYAFHITLDEMDFLFQGTLLGKAATYYMAMTIVMIPPIAKGAKKIIDWYNQKGKTNVIMFILTVSIAFWIIVYIKNTKQFDTTTYLMMIVLVCTLVILAITLARDKINARIKSTQYQRLKEYVDTYEALSEELRMSQHENKNRLVSIRGMVEGDNEKLLNYINSLIDDQPKVEHTWIVKLKNITDGGLKGLFYSKMMQMEELGINFLLDVSQSIKDNPEIENMDIEHYKNLCTVIGVFLDNAIEATKEISNPQVFVEFFYLNRKLQFIITNTYEGKIDTNYINTPGFTSKGTGHGYGLSLITRIVEKNPNYRQHTEVTDDYFIQYFTIELD